MATDISTQFVREAPEIEAQKLGLLQSSKALVDAANQAALQGRYLAPSYQIAGFSPDQVRAMEAARMGIGAYQPYMSAATQQMTGARGTLEDAINTMYGADTRNQFAAAQGAMNQAAIPMQRMGAAAQMVGQGSPFIAEGAGGLRQAQAAAQRYGSVDFAPSQRGMMNAAEQMLMTRPEFGAAEGMTQFGVGQGMQAAQMAQQAAQQPGFQQGIGALFRGAEMGQGAVGQAGAGMQRGVDTLYQAAQQAQDASRLGAAPMAQAAQAGAVPGVTSQNIQAAQTGYRPDLQAFQMGPAERVTTDTFAQPDVSGRFMSPYMQQVVDIEKREAQRQADIAGTRRGQAFARSGAFGGARQAIENAEAQRNLATQMGDIQSRGMQSAYQQAQQQFNVEQQARLAAQQANQQAGLTVGQQNLASQLGVQQLGTQTGLQTALANQQAQQQTAVQNEANRLQAQGMNAQQAMQVALANQQAQQQANLANQQMMGQYGIQGAQLGLQGAEMLRQAGIGSLGAAQNLGQLGLQGAGLMQAAGQGQMAGAGQMGQLGLSAAQQQAQAGQMGMQGAQQLASMEAQRLAARQAALQYYGGAARDVGQQALQAAQLGQAGAGLQGQLAGQMAGLSGMYGQLGAQQAGIYGQQAQLGQQLAQGIGSLAGQQFNIGAQLAQGMGALGGQQAGLAGQFANLGAQQQAMGQQDINFLYNLGAQQQRQQQAILDAQRQTQIQQATQPYQQLGFLSDIYKGAPSSQMGMVQQTQAAPSPFQQIAGLGIGGVSAAAAANRAGLF